ncbi:MAG TPA: SAM-dependent methyltransferase [Solirubrobacteraceae bacterium]|nr:SAM-dependent methyltransferase [Solirubrobacteraceae bacterium]
MHHHLTGRDFEQRYRTDPDPWSYEDSAYEHAKYEVTLEACGPGPFASAIELGGSIGVFTELLAPRCERLTTIDVSRTAATMAGRRLARFPGVDVLCGSIPDDVPSRTYDLVVASEILYYLDEDAFERTLAVIRARLRRGGRLVAVHFRPGGPERPFTGGQVHARLREDPWLRSVRGERAPGYLLDVLERR